MSQALPVLEARALVKRFPPAKGTAHAATAAVDGVSLVVYDRDVIGIVGASGSGKSTLARLLTRLATPTSGQVQLKGVDVHALDEETAREQIRPAIRMIFQDPDAALNPAYTIGEGLRRALKIGGRTSAEQVEATLSGLLADVGLARSYADKYPDELSGGEKRRLGICRVLASNPAVVVADEPLSGLDVVLQERVLSLLLKEQEARQFALLLVSHDLDRVHQVCSRVVVMFAGRIVESAPVIRGEIAPTARYRHPYAILLAEAKETFDRGLRLQVATRRSGGEIAADATLLEEADPIPGRSGASGCPYLGSCSRYKHLGSPDRCRQEAPLLSEYAPGWQVACHFANES